MKNEKEFKLEKSDTFEYEVYVVDEIIMNIYYYSYSFGRRHSLIHSGMYCPNQNLSSFILTLNEIVNIWQEKDPNTYIEFMNSLCDSEKENYFGKNSKPPVYFSSTAQQSGCWPVTITITIFNSKIFSIRHEGGFCDTISHDSLDKRISDVCRYLQDFLHFLLEYHNIDYYYKFLDNLDDEEKEKYFHLSYIPKNYK